MVNVFTNPQRYEWQIENFVKRNKFRFILGILIIYIIILIAHILEQVGVISDIRRSITFTSTTITIFGVLLSLVLLDSHKE